MNPKPNDIALNILAHVIDNVGQLDWETRLVPADRLLIRACCADAARLSVKALATPRNRDLQVDLLRDRACIQERLSKTTALGPDRLADAFWDAFRNTVNGAVVVAFAAM